jgi:hypothetical protein
MIECPDTLSLDTRIAAAFGDAAKSEHISGLIREVEPCIVDFDEAHRSAQKRSLDPASSEKVAAQARQEMHDALFRRERLQVAVTRLRQRLVEVRAYEEDERRRAAYEKIKADRDQLADVLAELYPAVADRLAELVSRIVKNDAAIDYVNAHLPQGRERLLSAELVARGLSGFRVDGLHDVPPITEQLRLPAFEWNAHHPFAWPCATRPSY